MTTPSPSRPVADPVVHRTEDPSRPVHVHAWVESKPGTVGAGAAAVCACGLYRVEPMPWEGDPAYYEKAAARARTLRLLYQQGYDELSTDRAEGGEQRG